MIDTKSKKSAQGQTVACGRRTAEVLELDALLAKAASLAMSRAGAKAVRRLRPCADLAVVERRLRRLSQLRSLLTEAHGPSLHGLEDIEGLLAQLRVAGAFLTPRELEIMAGFLSASGAAQRFLMLSGEGMDELYRLANALTELDDLAKRLRKIVGPGHTVASSASPALAAARHQMAKARDRLARSLGAMVNQQGNNSLFSDTVVTQRAGRFVVPVKAEAKGRVPGIIHDTSATGATCFMEPLEAVEDNNHLAMLRQAEREEEHRVLAEAAAMLADQLQALHENLAALAKLDCLLAQAKLCERLDCAAPRVGLHGAIILNTARHPLLAWREATGGPPAVPISVEMDDTHQVLIISGANAGGKTAALKTVGLTTLMVMCGMHAPLDSSSRVAVFDQVLADGGDEQDLESELSTFTAHAGRLAAMAQKAGKGSLVLIDELGASTDPSEGSALGMAVLDHLAAAKAKVLITTHYHRLKAYAAANEFATNASVAFDRTTGRPTFQLHYGLAGFSDALAVSRGLGFPDGLVAKAESYLDEDERTTSVLLQEAQQASQAAARELAQAKGLRRGAEEKLTQAQDQLKEASRQRAGALGEGKRKVREVAARLADRLEKVVAGYEQDAAQGRAAKPGRVRQELYKARREAVRQVEAAVAPPIPATQGGRPGAQLKAGASVMVASLGQKGTLVEDFQPDMESVAVSVGVSGVRIMVSPKEISAVEDGGEQPRPQIRVVVSAIADDGLDLNLVGRTVEDALPLVDKALDQAFLGGRKSINVIHGVGTGRLRSAIRDYLHTHPQVTSASPGLGRSAAAVTIAELRD